jgi:hypothetical protein
MVKFEGVKYKINEEKFSKEKYNYNCLRSIFEYFEIEFISDEEQVELFIESLKIRKDLDRKVDK